jgi:hypothetical protein
LRHYRSDATELDGETGAREPDRCAMVVTLSAERRRLLRLLARCPDGCRCLDANHREGAADTRAGSGLLEACNITGEVKRKPQLGAQCRQFIHTFWPWKLTIPAKGNFEGARAMADVMDLPVKVVSFQEEARECLQLAEAEPRGELRTILMGMALGWLELVVSRGPPTKFQIEKAEA